MDKKSFLSGTAIGVICGGLLGLASWVFLHDRSRAIDRPGTAEEWNSFTEKQRFTFVEGYTSGYAAGSMDACSNTDRLFESHGTTYLKDGTLNSPIAICVAALDHFTRVPDQGGRPADYAIYSDVISNFYQKYPKYANVPFAFLMKQLSDKNARTADELFGRFERHEITFTF